MNAKIMYFESNGSYSSLWFDLYTTVFVDPRSFIGNLNVVAKLHI